MIIREMTIEDYEQVLALWESDGGIYVAQDLDSKEMIEKYLARNKNLSFVACEGANVVGCHLAGHDGRNAELHHFVLAPEYQKKGIGGQLHEACVNALAKEGIRNIRVFIKEDNLASQSIAKYLGFKKKGAFCYSLLLPALSEEK